MVRVSNKYFWIILDVFLIHLAFLLSLLVRFGYGFGDYFYLYKDNILVISLVYLFFTAIFKIYDCIWRYISIKEIAQIGISILLTVFSSIIITYMYRGYLFPRTISFLFLFFNLTFIIGNKLFWRFNYEKKLNLERGKKRILVVGAGDAGEVISREIIKRGDLGTLVGFIDDDRMKAGKIIHGKRVLGNSNDIEKLVEKNNIDSIIIAMPSASGKQISKIVSPIQLKGIEIKTLPGLYELVDGKVSYSRIRKLQIEDILGREPIHLNMEAIHGNLMGKVILVSGAGGSIGSEISRQVCHFQPKSLILLDSSENNLYKIFYELKQKYPNGNLVPLLLNITNKMKLENNFQQMMPDVIYHAAAHKHVPILEYYPEEAVWNNIIGTRNLAEMAHQFRVDRFVMISTDKAINPSSVMGASKRIAEMIVQDFGKNSQTKFAAVRFGNVLDSSGSVIPLFRKQIDQGGPVTVTDKEVKRYFMTMAEASQLVIQAGVFSESGKVFVLDMGEPIKIYDLAEEMIRLMGFEPIQDIDIQLIGLRPGEKLFEELLSQDEKSNMELHTSHEKIFVAKVQDIDGEKLFKDVSELEKLAMEGDGRGIVKKMQKMLPNYTPYREEELLREYKW